MAASNLWTPPADFTTGEMVTATKGNQHWRDNEQYLHLKDEFGYNSYATDGSAFSTVESDIILVTSVVVPTGHNRPIWHEAMLHFAFSVADTVVQLKIIDTTGGGSTLLNKFFDSGNVAAQPNAVFIAHRQDNPGAGTYSYKITGIRNTGTGTITRRGASDNIGWYKVRGG